MKQNLRRAVNITALVLAAGLLIGLVTGCQPKIDPKYNYRVEHLQQNIQDDDYTLCATETLRGKASETTSAAAKTYAGFKVQSFSQAAIKADGSTVVQIKYNRNIITLKLNLTGGTTTTPLTDGEGGIQLLKGKFGAKVELKKLRKGSDVLDVWEPELPSTFPASSPDTTYTASWTDKYRITVKGDERIDSSLIEIEPDKTWNHIKTQIESNVSLKAEWNNGDYEIYEWRLGGETGEKISNDYPIDKHLTVYAVTNYAKFNIDGTKIKLTSDGKGYTGEKPKGKIIIPDGITEIEDATSPSNGAFKNCTEISSVKFPQTLTTIGWFAFLGCTGLTSISLPENLTTIDRGAFDGCTGLTSISLPANLTTIGDGAFLGCTGLTSLSLPANLTTIGGAAFAGCTGLTSLTVDSRNTEYKSIDNVIYTKDGLTLVAAAGSLSAVNIPDTVTTIGVGAFYSCTCLTSISLPANLTTIGVAAFELCTGLTSIRLPANLTTIDRYAFYECTGLTSAVFADKNGWKVYDNDSYSGTSTPISSSDLASPETAAKYLREETDKGGYCDKYWKKN